MSLSNKFGDARMKRLGTRLRKIYAQASEELTDKVNSFFADFEKLDKKKLALVKAGKLSEEEYKKWRKNKVLMSEKYMDLRDTMAKRMTEANTLASQYINGELPAIYAHNFNSVVGDVTSQVKGFSFDLVDEYTVRKLSTSDKTLLPYKFVDGHKDVRWNTKRVNSQILQGLLQGESADQMAFRLTNVTKMNEMSALRNARTAVTSAQNKGRVDAMEDLQEAGVILEKEWIATKDERTRDAHAELDRVSVPVDEPFVNEIGEIMYPGDPDADPANTYNCRCTIAEVVKGFKPKEEKTIESEAEKFVEPEEPHTIAEGQDITDTWERRPDAFDFEIDDVINAQGFDGLPRVVSQEEFDKAVEESSFVAQRTYSAPDKETLDQYRDSLYNGDWYVDCSSGKSLFGQGMYCSADYDGVLSDGIKADMDAYRAVGERKGNNFSYTETITLTPDAKIIDYDELERMKSGIVTQEEMNMAKEDVFKNIVSEQNDDMKLYIRDYIGLPMTDEQRKLFDTIEDNVLDLPKEERQKINETAREAQKTYMYRYPDAVRTLENARAVEAEKIRGFDDIGSAAVALGYDAISANGNGRSGNYTVILNRTKCIFLGDD